MARNKNKVRKDGRVAVQVYLGRDKHGKRKYKTVYGKTQKEADEKALDVKLFLKKGIDVTSQKDIFGKWAKRWLKIKKTEVSAARYVVYRSNIKHLERYFEYVEISKIKTADIQDIILNLSENNPNTNKPMARSTIIGIKSTAKQVFQLMVDNRVLEYNPAEALKIAGQSTKEKRRALTEEEQKWITDTVHNAKIPAMIMLYAGLRRGEVIPLLWSDIDLNAATITVTKAVETSGNKFVYKDSTKTEAGMRTVDIPEVLVDFLKNQHKKSEYVTVSAKNKMHTYSSWVRMWESYLADINIKYGDFSGYEKEYKSKFDPDGVPFVIPKITPHWL